MRALLTVPSEAETVVDVLAVTFFVLIVNVALVFPAGTETDADTVAAEVFELFKVIDRPPVGAGALIVTVPDTEPAPPLMVDFANVRFVKTPAFTSNDAVLMPLSEPVTVTGVSAETP